MVQSAVRRNSYTFSGKRWLGESRGWEHNIKMDYRDVRELWEWNVDGTSTGSFSNTGFGVGGIEASCSVTIHS
jgi:hypothetical protein